MADPGVTRVAVYIDFDNIVISRYDQVHGRPSPGRNRSDEGDRRRARWASARPRWVRRRARRRVRAN